MLPDLRFLLSAIILSMSILVFGLGAAALLRTAHEEFASNSSWRTAPEAMLTQPAEATPPVLATLRVDPPIAQLQLSNGIAVTLTSSQAVPTATAPSAAAPASMEGDLKQGEAETATTLKPDDLSLSPPAMHPLTAVAGLSTAPRDSRPLPDENDMPVSAIPAAVDQGAGSFQPANAPALPGESAGASTPGSPTAPGETALPANIASTKTVNLDPSSAAVATPSQTSVASGKLTAANPDPAVAKKQLEARRAAQRRKTAMRARMARDTQQRQAQAQPATSSAEQFAQPPIAGNNR